MSKNKENTDYRDTLLLPDTDLPMRAKLPEKEPEILKDWAKKSLFSRIRESSQDKDKFVLHDGPPYANGNLHMGTALNKILKDVIVRSKQMEGYDCEYRPGWDCHGLPIEWKVEENFRKKGKNIVLSQQLTFFLVLNLYRTPQLYYYEQEILLSNQHQ